MIWNFLSIYLRIMHLTRPVHDPFGWQVVTLKLLAAARFVPATVLHASMFPLFIVFPFKTCGYLVVVVILPGSTPLIMRSWMSVIFWWSCSFGVVGVFSICKSVGHVHYFSYRSGFSSAHFLDKVLSAYPAHKGIDRSLFGYVFCWIFYYILALYALT
jgi:hypothetical protein